MRINILKLSFLLFIIFSLNACKKKNKVQYKVYGYIYNSIDSTPFTNTNFKLWEKGNTYDSDHETPFMTDDNGYFDITIDVGKGISVCWPSFCDCAGYLGPQLSDPVSETINSETNLHTIYYDTIYSIPYH
jgi:hypothetical protein